MPDTPGTTVDTVTKAAEKIRSGEPVKMADLLTTLVPRPEGVGAPARLPMPAAITDSERKALERLPEVYGRVVPEERRALAPAEVTMLVEERTTLDDIKKMVEKRVANIRITIYNHLDVEAEKTEGFDPDATLRDKDGFYVLDGVAEVAPGTGKTFKRETRGGSPSLTEPALKALVDNPDFPEFTHADYLAMTEQVRVVEEHKAMLHLTKNPGLLAAIQHATKPGTKTSALNLRNAD